MATEHKLLSYQKTINRFGKVSTETFQLYGTIEGHQVRARFEDRIFIVDVRVNHAKLSSPAYRATIGKQVLKQIDVCSRWPVK